MYNLRLHERECAAATAAVSVTTGAVRLTSIVQD